MLSATKPRPPPTSLFPLLLSVRMSFQVCMYIYIYIYAPMEKTFPSSHCSDADKTHICREMQVFQETHFIDDGRPHTQPTDNIGQHPWFHNGHVRVEMQKGVSCHLTCLQCFFVLQTRDWQCRPCIRTCLNQRLFV